MKKVLASFVFFILIVGAKAQSVQNFEILNPNRKISWGQAMTVKISPHYLSPNTGLYFNGNSYQPDKQGFVYVGIGEQTKPGLYIIYLTLNGVWDRGYSTQVEILERKYPTSPGIATQRKLSETERRRLDLLRAKERQRKDEAYKKADAWEVYALSEFVRPLDLPELIITDGFGTKRRMRRYDYNQKKYELVTTPHAGTDLKTYRYGPGDTNYRKPVLAINSGRVILAEEFSADGKMVVIDHGSGILSFYLHLSRINVKDGDLITVGKSIGLAGMTGNVTGPHLHFAVKVNGVNVDPLEFIEDMNKHR